MRDDDEKGRHVSALPNYSMHAVYVLTPSVLLDSVLLLAVSLVSCIFFDRQFELFG